MGAVMEGVTRPDPRQIPTTLMTPAMDAGQPAAQAGPELAAAMAESRELRALVAEILDTLASQKYPPARMAKWRERAGLGHT